MTVPATDRSTTQDVSLKVPLAERTFLPSGRTLLLIVDPENEFCHPEGALYLGDSAVSAVSSCAELVGRAREAAARIVWIRSVRAPDSWEFKEFGESLHLLEGSWGVEFASPLAPGADEPVFEKRCHDCFVDPALGEWLRATATPPHEWVVLVAGVALDVCVNHAVLGLSARAYRVRVVLDCVAPREGARAAAPLSTYASPAYSYNVRVTRSDLLEFEGGNW